MGQVVKKVFLRDIQNEIFAGVEFIKEAVSHDMWVNNDTVYIPQSGTNPAVVENRTILPAIIKQRTDTEKSYSLNEYTTDPILLRDLEKIQLSYDKRKSLMQGNIDALNDRIALQALYQWAGANLIASDGQIILTTDITNKDAHANPPGATGNRNAIALEDIMKAAAKLDDDEVPIEGRYLIMPSKMYWNHLVKNNPTIVSRDYNPKGDIISGIVRKLFGFNIILRSYTAAYADASTPTLKAVGAASAATDCFSCVGFHKSKVAKALGSIKFFEAKESPTMFGDVLSAKVMFNATKIRTDGKGIVTIVQDKT